MKKTLCLFFAILLLFVSIVPAVNAETIKYTKGNVDGKEDGITSSDALLVLQHSVGKITLSAEQLKVADVDGDKDVDAADALMILQAAVGKIQMGNQLYEDYSEYEYNYVAPTGLKEGTMYVISSSFLKDKDTGRNHDAVRLAVCIQGLINRNNDKHHVAIELRLDETDDFWLNFMSEDGATYDSAVYTQQKVRSFSEFYTTFLPFIQEHGIIAWDPNCPSTANVASTICGLDGYLPVQYSTDSNSLYQVLTTQYDVKVKMSLVGMFEGAKLGSKIADTNLESTGSVKCDPYIWALDKYMERCNPELLAYTPDGMTAVASSWLAKRGDAGSASLTGIPNHDYFIAKQMFFFDLTSYGDEQPCDDPNQPLHTDPETLAKILQKRYDMTGGMFGMAIGFPPWHLKYTRHINADALSAGILNQNDDTFDMDPARLEWHFVEFVTSYNIGIEADAAHPCWMSNGSLYYKYEMRYSATQNQEAKSEVKYDKDTYYYTVVWTGDFDCSPWMKARVPNQWSEDTNRGSVDMTYGYNVNLSQRIPMAFDYIFSQRTDRDYLVGGEGCGYTFPSALWQGFTGSEATKASGPSGFYGKTENSVVHRTNPDGGESYYNYAKTFFDKLGINTSARVINGFNVIEEKSLDMLSKLSPGGVFVQASTAGSINIRRYKDLICMRITDIGDASGLYSALHKSDAKCIAFGYCNPGQNWATPTGMIDFLNEFSTLAAKNDPNGKYQYVDVSTFVEMVKQSGKYTTIK